MFIYLFIYLAQLGSRADGGSKECHFRMYEPKKIQRSASFPHARL